MKVELSPEARELVEAGRTADGPSPLQRARSQERLVATLGAAAFVGAASKASATGALTAGVQGGTAVTGGTATAPAAALGAGKAAGALAGMTLQGKVVAAVLAVGATVGLGVGAWPSDAPRTPISTTQTRASTGADRGDSPAPAAPAAAEENAETPLEAVGIERAQPVRASLREELELLGAAQAHLRRDDPQRALEALDLHRKRFPHGALRQESTAARAIALCRLGRVEEGQQLSRELSRRAPSSPLVSRVRQACP